jgi:hypothetical protein
MGTAAQAMQDPYEVRRRRNREYMRAWRSQPENQERERQSRQRWHYHRKLREEEGARHPVCGFCHRREPIAEVVRLRPIPTGYVQVLVPYCGEC